LICRFGIAWTNKVMLFVSLSPSFCKQTKYFLKRNFMLNPKPLGCYYLNLKKYCRKNFTPEADGGTSSRVPEVERSARRKIWKEDVSQMLHESQTRLEEPKDFLKGTKTCIELLNIFWPQH
jgi:hypothetical protein